MSIEFSCKDLHHVLQCFKTGKRKDSQVVFWGTYILNLSPDQPVQYACQIEQETQEPIGMPYSYLDRLLTIDPRQARSAIGFAIDPDDPVINY